MFFFGLQEQLREFLKAGKSIVCWSAGAMTLCDSIVLYYDDPPDGAGIAEILDTGLGLINDTLFFPHGKQRLKSDQPPRIRSLARRFAPQSCIILESGAHLIYEDHQLTYAKDGLLMDKDGQLQELAP